VVVVSWALGVYAFVDLTVPWVNPKRVIQTMRRGTPRHHITDERNSSLYDLCQSAAMAIRGGELPQARALVARGAKQDPANPLFDYLSAAISDADDDSATALSLVDQGNAKGELHLYSTNRVLPDRWNRFELLAISHMARQLVKVRNKDLSALLTLYDLAQKLSFCNPADYSVVTVGLNLRRFVARKIADADSGRLTPEAREYFGSVADRSRASWRMFEGALSHFDFVDPRSRLSVAMRKLRRSGNTQGFIEAYILSQDMEAERTAAIRRKHVKPRPERVLTQR
jgi:hypothetical protein